jgi:redox-sensitive bicupin YhaK (pirin superfamily)
MSVSVGRPFQLGRGPWKTLDPFMFCVFHEDKFPKGEGSTLGPDPKLLRGRDLTMDFSYQDGWSMYHGTEVPGFPQHPHRGFETVTCAMKGLVDHFDSMGATGRYGHGDIQWMTAGSGVQHSEMFPLVNTDKPNPMELFQIWLNLPQAKKDAPPFFEMFWAPQVPVVTAGDAEVTVVAGDVAGSTACKPPPDSWASVPDNEVAIWIVRIKKTGGKVTLPPTVNGKAITRTAYFFKGQAKSVTFASSGRDSVSLPSMAAVQLDPTVSVDIAASDDGDAEVLILQGRPIGEPVVQRGPFVANSNEDLREVIERYHRTQFGGWPWPSPDVVHPPTKDRFAKRPGAKEEEYPPKA